MQVSPCKSWHIMALMASVFCLLHFCPEMHTPRTASWTCPPRNWEVERENVEDVELDILGQCTSEVLGISLGHFENTISIIIEFNIQNVHVLISDSENSWGFSRIRTWRHPAHWSIGLSSASSRGRTWATRWTHPPHIIVSWNIM